MKVRKKIMNNFNFEKFEKMYEFKEREFNEITQYLDDMEKFDITPVLLLYKSKITPQRTKMVTKVNGKDLIDYLAATSFKECLRQGLSAREINEALDRAAKKVVEIHDRNGEDFYG